MSLCTLKANINLNPHTSLTAVIMAIQVLVQALKSILFFFVGIWRRALCCFRRRRRMSCDSIPLTAVGVVSDYAGPSCSTGDDTWNSWEEPGSFKPNSVQEHIEMYRQQTMAARHPSVDGEEPVHQDFFQDMAPRITRQTKVFIDDNESEQGRGVTSRLSLAPQPIVPEGELGVWEDTQGWEEQTQPDWDPQLVLREKRRQERERRIWEQQQRKEKVMRPLSLGAKIS